VNYFPEYNVTRWPFSECAPRTEEGIRRLAYIAIEVLTAEAAAYIDELELLMLQAKRIKPDGYGSDWPDEIKPVEIEHVRRKGRRLLKVRWLHAGWDDCDVCFGKGHITATGGDGLRHKFDCTECEDGKVERDPEYIETDIDGTPWRLAA
jgi:hypothetical protein